MRAIEFKSKISNNQISIPKKVQSELLSADEKNVRVMIFLDDHDFENANSEAVELSKEELDSINKGLKDFDEGKTHSNETARKLYGKYL